MNPQQPRILHVLCQKPSHTGSGYYLSALLEQGRQLGHQLAVVCGIQNEDILELERVFPVQFQAGELNFPIVGMSDVMPYESTRWRDMTEEMLQVYNVQFGLALKEAVAKFKPDIIHCHHLWVLTALVRGLFPNIKVVASCHGTGLRQQEKLTEIASTIRPILGRVDHIFCLTHEQELAVRDYATSTSIVGAGFNASLFSPGTRTIRASTRFLYAGKLSRSKGCLELLEAMKPLLGEECELALAGSGHGPEADSTRARATEMGVELLGRLSQQELAQEMRLADVFVLPSYFEGLPLVLAEALSCGCRLVVTSLPGVLTWLPKPLKESSWIQIVELPRLHSADEPCQEDIPAFVSRLKDGLQIQLTANPVRPAGLDNFLKLSTWSGVYQRISEHYSMGEDS